LVLLEVMIYAYISHYDDTTYQPPTEASGEYMEARCRALRQYKLVQVGEAWKQGYGWAPVWMRLEPLDDTDKALLCLTEYPVDEARAVSKKSGWNLVITEQGLKVE
jgi:hypothetical protein